MLRPPAAAQASANPAPPPPQCAQAAALQMESRHEIVALLPSSRMLTLNFANWNRMRAAGSMDEPTLVMSFLGAQPHPPPPPPALGRART